MESNKGEDEYPLFEDNKDARRTKGAHGTTSKGEEHRLDRGTSEGSGFFGNIDLTLPTFAIRPSLKGVPYSRVRERVC